MIFSKYRHYLMMLAAAATLASCGDDDNIDPTDPIDTPDSKFVVAVESPSGSDVLVTKDTVMTGTVSPIGQGEEQIGWRYFFNAGDVVLSSGTSSGEPSCIGYELENGQLSERGRFVFTTDIYNYGLVDNSTVLGIGVPRAGFEPRVLNVINTESMSITESKNILIDERRADSLVAWPTALKVRGDKLFIPYYLLHTRGDFSTPNSDSARIAVYSYPGLEFEKHIADPRTSDIGIYSSFTGLVEDENGDLYSFSSSSLASGYAPVPSKPSGILRINAGETEFDENYFFNFEQASGGYKINDMVYAGNGKAVVRMVVEDNVLWGTYAPNTENPMCRTAVVDLEAMTVTEVQEIPLHGGSWGMAHLVHDGHVYLNISNASGANIYIVDPETATAQKGATIEGNYAKGIFHLEENE
ncbi:DUF4374 domain-containing protein [Roseivirga sp. BDSF3-8]|uniref:DUF4374 domain-containing protein n=1 Tax=Roseivirga sp. BDSF3-8 TaxID=3241598 RepID=UPI003531FF50